MKPSNRIRGTLLMGILLLIVVAVAGYFRREPVESPVDRPGELGIAAGSGSVEGATILDTRKPRPSRPRLSAGDDAEDPAISEIDGILADTTLTERQAAQALLELVARTDPGDPAHYAALTQGLNLDFEVFAATTADPELDPSLARRYLDETGGNHRTLKDRIEVRLNLMNHHDDEIRLRSAKELAELLGVAGSEATPATLREAAVVLLEEIRRSANEPELQK